MVTNKKSPPSIYQYRYRKRASYAKNNHITLPAYVWSTGKRIYVNNLRLTWGAACGVRLSVPSVLPIAWPHRGETHGYSFRIPPQIFLWNIPPATPWSHSSPTPDIPDTLPEVLMRLLLLEVSYKRNTFKELLLKASSLVAISCSIADTIRTPYTPLIHYCYYCL